MTGRAGAAGRTGAERGQRSARTGGRAATVWLVTICATLHALPFLARPALVGGDEPHYALMARAIATDRALDPSAAYRRVEAGSAEAGRKAAGKALDRHTADRGGREVFTHPLGLPALAAPLVGLLAAVAPAAAPDLLLGGLTLAVTFAALLAGWELLVRELGSRRDAAVVAFGLYFATPLWYYSRTFFTEPYVWALAVLGAWCVARGRWTWASLLLGLACVVKETAVLLAVAVAAAAWRRHGSRALARLAPFPILLGVLWVVKNLYLYGSPLATFQPYRVGDPLAGAIGTLFDLRHGLLPFAPVLVLAAFGLTRAGAGPSARRDLAAISLTAFGAWFVVTACWVDWRGGSCYGPRLMVPAIVALALPVAEAWRRFAGDVRFRAAARSLVLAGFVVAWTAATHPFAAFWGPSAPGLLARFPITAAAGLVVGAALLRALPRLAEATTAPP